MLTTLTLFRNEFQKVWWPAYRVLKEVVDKERPSPSQKELLKEWQSLGNELGLSDSKESAEFQKGQAEARKVAADFCAWVACRYNSEKSSSRMRVCAGCEEPLESWA
ncbi:hypothetical protein PENSPDRAFT_210805 [Peniophora sp. CONT]|nr:hypothetical protein PENSPDRAFT_210805 [Peniophora sp. CONT]